MSSKITYGIALVLAVLVLWGLCGKTPLKRSESFAAFNTVCTVTVWDSKPDRLEPLLREIAAELQNIHNRFNAYDVKSELSRLNATAATEPFKCSDELWEMLEEAERAWRFTDGAFDPTVGPLMKLWGYFEKKNAYPTDDEIAETLKMVGFDKLRLENHTAEFTVPGMKLDFGGMVKGYALDKISAKLDAAGVKVYLLDFGGNLKLSAQAPPGRKTFTVGVLDPNTKNSLDRTEELINCAVSSSGNYERSRVLDGRRVGHIMDPRTGKPCDFLGSVTVAVRRGIDSDVLSTAVFIGGGELEEKIMLDPDVDLSCLITIPLKGR